MASQTLRDSIMLMCHRHLYSMLNSLYSMLRTPSLLSMGLPSAVTLAHLEVTECSSVYLLESVGPRALHIIDGYLTPHNQVITKWYVLLKQNTSRYRYARYIYGSI